MKKLVLFDLDGTLLDTIRDLGAAVNHALCAKGYAQHDMDEFPAMVGRGIRNLVKRAMPEELRGDDKAVDECLSIFKEYYSAHIDVYTRPYEGMPELLSDLNAKGIKMAVVSNKFQEGAEKLVGEFFPEIPFVCILGNREGHPLKPDPAIVEEVLNAAGMEKSAAILVGDSIPDMQTAAGAGIGAIAVAWGYCRPDKLAGNRLAGTPEVLKDFLLF